MGVDKVMLSLGLRARGLHWAFLPAVLLVSFATTGCAPASQDNPVLAIVNGKAITLSEFDFRWSELPESARARYQSEGGKRQFLEELISRELLMQEARKRGLHRSPSVRYRTQRFEETLLLDQVMREAVKEKVEVSQEELEEYYASHGAVLPAPDRIEVSQIVSKNIYASRDIKRMLNEGVSFAALAKRYSTDQYSRAKGGDIGLYQKGTAPPEVEAAIYKLRPGWTSDPIKTESGFYIVRVNSRKPGDTKAVMAARERLKQELYSEKRQTHIKAYLVNLKSSATIRIGDASKYVTGSSGPLPVTPKP